MASETISARKREAMAAQAAFTKDNPRKVWALKDDAPDWLRDAVYAAHGGSLPDDRTYELCRDAMCWINENDGEPSEDDIHAEADNAVPVYNSERAAWLAEDASRFEEIDSVAAEFGSESASTFDKIGMAMFAEIEGVYRTLFDAWSEYADSIESEDDEPADDAE